jgi:amidase
MTGQPAISLPIGTHEDLPVPIQLAAASGREDVLLSLARQMERDETVKVPKPALYAC